MVLSKVYLTINEEPSIILVYRGNPPSEIDVELGASEITNEVVVRVDNEYFSWEPDEDVISFLEEILVKKYVWLIVKVLPGKKQKEGKIIFGDSAIEKVKIFIDKLYGRI